MTSLIKTITFSIQRYQNIDIMRNLNEIYTPRSKRLYVGSVFGRPYPTILLPFTSSE